MGRQFFSGTIFVNPHLKDLLNRFSPGLFNIYDARRMSSSSVGVSFTQLNRWSEDIRITTEGLKKKYLPYPKGCLLDLVNPEVLEVRTPDIELFEEDRFGQITVASNKGILVKYGEKGIVVSKGMKPKDLLAYSIIIPPGFGVLDIEKHRPFLIEAQDKNSIAFATCQLNKTPEFSQLKKYRMLLGVKLPNNTAKILTNRIQGAIYESKESEDFYKEKTLKFYHPEEGFESSGTFMSFETDDLNDPTADSTDMHYHPGARDLIIVTTEIKSGAELNFCGISENPDKRQDCSVAIDFPSNSIVVVRIPPYTHHKFKGRFVCISVHPKDGKNIIDALNSGTLPKGFLESATVFSGKAEEEKWNLSLPSEDKSYKTKQSSYSR